MATFRLDPQSERWLTPAIRERMQVLGLPTDTASRSPHGRDRTPKRTHWLSSELDVKVRCIECGDYARIGSTTPEAPACSCAAIAVLETERDTARLARFADARAARPGRCCIAGCDEPGRHWTRESTAAGVRAIRTCARHELLGEHLLSRVTIEDAARMATPAQRRRAIAAAERHERAARGARAESARLAGASSATHTAALIGGWHAAEAEKQRAFARACAEVTS